MDAMGFSVEKVDRVKRILEETEVKLENGQAYARPSLGVGRI